MARAIKHKRYQANTSIPNTGYEAGELLIAIDSEDMYFCPTSTKKVLLGKASDFLNYLVKAQNLSDVPDKAAARNNLGVYAKTEVDNLLSGLNWKSDVLALSTTNIMLSGVQTIDGISCPANSRVAVTGQTDRKTNGIYIVKTTAWVRAVDANTAVGLSGATFGVSQGVSNADTIWRVFTDNITLGTTEIGIEPFTGFKSVMAGLGLTIEGNTISVAFDELSSVASYGANAEIILYDPNASVNARHQRIKVSALISQIGIISDTYKVKATSSTTEGFLTDVLSVGTGKGLKKSISGNAVLLEQDIATLPDSTELVAGTSDMVAVHNISINRIEKVSPEKLIEDVIIDAGIF